MNIKTKYGEIKVIEDENGEIKIYYNTDYDILIQCNATNSITFHTIQPRTNKILTKKNLREM